MSDSLEKFLSMLNLEPIEENVFCGQSGNTIWQRVFGGQVVAQALVAAQRTVPEDRFVHSLHAYFLRPGKPEVPIIYKVEIVRNGGSFSARRVVAQQNYKTIFTLSCSFQLEEKGLEYYRPMPQNIPQPEEVKEPCVVEDGVFANAPEIVKAYWKFHRPFSVRPIDLDNYLTRRKMEPKQQSWFKLDGPIKENRQINAAILAYLSDMTLLDTALCIHGKSIFSHNVQSASIDHSMWFHRPFSLVDWLFYELESPNSSGSRGFSRGFIYNRQGELIASVAQEGLMRLITEEKG